MMDRLVSRRQFLGTGLSAGAAWVAASAVGLRPAWGIEPIRRPGGPRFALSLAAYSFREFFSPKAGPRRITLLDFIDYCAEQGLQATELTSYYFPEPVQEDFLRQVRRHAFLRGLAISGTAVGNNFVLPAGPERDRQIKLVKTWVDHAAVLGAPHIRVFAGSKPATMDMAKAKALCIEALQECCEYAGRRGIFLGLENHHGIVAEAEDMLDIVRAVQSPWFGVNLDTGNFYTDDPYADLAKCAPYAVNVQVKIDIRRRNQKKSEPADLARLAQILREANYQGYVALEYEGQEDPWTAVPVWLKKMKAAFST